MNLSPLSGNKKTLLDGIYNINPNGATPLRVNLNKTGRYFECKSGDIFGSAADSAPGDPDCPVLVTSEGGACQMNYTILVTDGYYDGFAAGVGNTDKDTGVTASNFDGGALEDNFADTLADVAMNYYERDLQPTLEDKVQTTILDRARYPLASGYPTDVEGNFDLMPQHMTTYAVGFGVDGTLSAMPTDPTAAFAWPDPSSANKATKVDDLRHTAYNGRGDYLSAKDPTALSEALNQIFAAIGQEEGAASAVAFNTQNIDSGSLVFRAFFNTVTNSGDLVAHKVNLDGTIDVSVEEWSAAGGLQCRSTATTDDRIIFTYKDTGDATSAGIPFEWANLTTGVESQQESLNLPVPGNVADVGDERLDWIRGHTGNEGPNFDDGQLRERLTGSGEKELLGDIVHSAPVFVGQPPFSGRDNLPYPNTVGQLYSDFKLSKLDREELVYVGANDGMLHAFDANTGQEKFAFVPNMLFNNNKLSNLTKPNYSHEFYVDLTPTVNDTYINSSWNTVLIGGMGKGGQGYYALNVTDPASFATEAGAAANVMWEFTSTDDDALGYSFSEPLIVMTNDGPDGGKTWVAIFGNGYNSSNADGDAELFVLKLTGGLDGDWTDPGDYIKISTLNGIVESGTNTPNGISGISAVDLDQNGTVDYVYAGDLQGNLYRFNFQGDMASWGLDGLLYKARYDDTGPIQPITNAPVVIPHPNNSGFIVIFGTGSWMTTADRTDGNIQSIYGIWDDLGALADGTEIGSAANGTVTYSMLVEQQFINHANEEEGFTVRTSTSNEVVWDNAGADQVRGWYINFDMPSADGSKPVEFAGERAVRRFHIRGGLLFVNTIIPKLEDICLGGAGGYELGFCPETGGSCDKTVFDLNNDGVFNIDDNVGDLEGSDVIVTGKRFDDSTPADSSFIGDTQVTQTSDKSIRTSKTNTSNNALHVRHSLREIDQ
jgi:type IV pilus assembly protein PilY1